MSDFRDCKHCKHLKAGECSRWDCEYEPKVDYISRLDAIDRICGTGYADQIKENVNFILMSLPSADRQDDNRLYIKIYADDEPSRKAEKLYQICGETENQEVAQWLKEYFPSADRPTGEWIPVSERLPDDKTYVLTTIQVNGRQPHARSGFYHGGFFHNDNGETWRATEKPLKAWMPLPEPYREDGEE